MSEFLSFLIIKLFSQWPIALAIVFNGVTGYFNPNLIGYAHTIYCDKLAANKDVLSIYILLHMKVTDPYLLEPALVSALPPDLAVKHLNYINRKDKLDWYRAILGLSKHKSFITDVYLCEQVIHTGSEDVRLAGYIAARDAKSGLLVPLAIIDYLQLRSIPIRYTYPYGDRQKIISDYIARTWSKLTGKDILLNFLCLLKLKSIGKENSTISCETGYNEIEALALLCYRDLQCIQRNGEPEYFKLARQLGKDGKWDSLRRIFADNRFNRHRTIIVREAISASCPRDAIPFIRTISKEDNAWHMAMSSFSTRHDRVLKSYVLEIAGDQDPYVRATCYGVCRDNHWAELLEQARADSTSTERYHPQYYLSCGLADDAKSYRVEMGDLPKNTPIELARTLKIPERPKGEPLFPEGKPGSGNR